MGHLWAAKKVPVGEKASPSLAALAISDGLFFYVFPQKKRVGGHSFLKYHNADGFDHTSREAIVNPVKTCNSRGTSASALSGRTFCSSAWPRGPIIRPRKCTEGSLKPNNFIKL